jgi:hypothetical protein
VAVLCFSFFSFSFLHNMEDYSLKNNIINK